MFKLIRAKMKEAISSVLPVSLIVIILSFIPIFNIPIRERITFIVCSLLLIIGIALFSAGADLAMSKMGDQIGSSLVKTRKLWLIIVVCFIMGMLITMAEPDLSVLAGQAETIFNSKILLIIVVGVGVGLFLVFAVLKILLKKDLATLLLFFYLVMFALVALNYKLGNALFMPLAFDSGGVTTGPITVPFLMALGVGIAFTAGGRNYKENSFGIVALCSVGPIIAVLILSLTASSGTPIIDTDYSLPGTVFGSFISFLLTNIKDVAISLGLIVGVFLIINFIFIRLSRAKLMQIGMGTLLTFIGLVIFLTAVQLGYMPMGYSLGKSMAEISKPLVAIFGFVIGAVVVIAEPAIMVLTKQVEEITTGGVSKRSMLIALSIGVGLAICLSIIRIIFEFSILYYLIPGYIISLGLSFFVPKLYTSIAFDSGGVASGPLTSSFILPFAVGVCVALCGTEGVLEYAFGIVAMVAMAPLIAIQFLGFKDIVNKRMKYNSRVKKLTSSDDERIICFD